MKLRLSSFLLVLLLLVIAQGCSPKVTRPGVDLKEISDQIVRTPANNQAQEAGKEAGVAQPRIKDMSVSAPSEHELKKIPNNGVVPSRSEAGADGILLNFDNADIYEFIQVISEALGINYIVDPKVKGSVNIRSGQKIGKDQLFGVFQKVLHINGLDVRNEGDYYSIHPSKGGVPQQVFGPTEVGSLKASSRLVVQVLPVVHIASAEAQKLVEPYLSEVGSIYNLTSQNTLIVSDFESKVLDIASVLARLDISPLSALKVRMVKIDHAPLFTMRDELKEILAALAVNPKEHESVSIIPLERVNSLLLISKSEQLLENTDRWIRELDVAPIEGRDTLFFYNVRNSVATELAGVVNALINGEDVPAKAAVVSESLGAQNRMANDLGLQAKATTGGNDSLSKLSSSSGGGLGSKSSGLQQDASGGDEMSKSATAGKAESLSTLSTTSKGGGMGGGKKGRAATSLNFAGEPMLIADDTRNVIIIRALMPDYTRLVKILERLDTLPRQVLIEVLVAEVTLNDSWEFGVEWALKNNKLNINGSKYTQYYTTAAGSSTNSGLQSIPLPTGPSGTGKAYGFAYSVFNSAGDMIGLLSALADQTNVSLLSSPQVLVLNNEQAVVNVGDQIPIVTSESVPLTTTDLRTSTVQYKDTGTILKVRPRINKDGVIILDIDQQVSAAVQNTLGGTTSPIISTRELKTKLVVKNGQAIMMGGLIKKDNTTNQSKVPLLGDIPVLGWAFKSEKQANVKTELLVMITPYVIESDDVLDQYISKFQEKMQGLRQGLDVKKPAARPAKESLEDKRENGQ